MKLKIPKDKVNKYTRKTLVLSTAHLPYCCAYVLDNHSDVINKHSNILIDNDDIFGYLFMTLEPNEHDDKFFPKEVSDILRSVHASGYDYVRFDGEGLVLDNLTQYEW